MLKSGRRDRNMYWERIQAHNSIVTCALFAPKPQLILDNIYKIKTNSNNSSISGSNSKNNQNNVHVLVSAAGCDGKIKIFVNKLSKPIL
jgi:WD repeat-containing protein 44